MGQYYRCIFAIIAGSNHSILPVPNAMIRYFNSLASTRYPRWCKLHYISPSLLHLPTIGIPLCFSFKFWIFPKFIRFFGIVGHFKKKSGYFRDEKTNSQKYFSLPLHPNQTSAENRGYPNFLFENKTRLCSDKTAGFTSS